MDRERIERIESLYEAARRLDASERARFLASECAGDPELRGEVASLLDHGEQAGEFLEQSAIEVLAGEIGAEGPSLAGRRIGHYDFLSLIGRGGMGQVWRARDTRLGRDVAIKTLPGQFAADGQRMARFKREAQVLASVNHPGIAAIYGFEELDGVHCLVMELVDGETLAEGMARGPVPVEESIRLSVQVAEALEAAHEKGVIHRDLKPANIVVTGEGQTKLLDFGLAKALEGDGGGTARAASSGRSAGISMDGVILGTAAYMSPEQARGAAIDKRTDIWALGCVLYELLTGRRAFAGDMLSDVIASVLAREPDLALLDGYHPALRRLVAQCLAKDAAQRFRDVGDVRIELARLLSGPPGSLTRAASPRYGSRRRMAAAVAAAIAVGVAGAAAGWIFRTPAPERNGRFVVSASPSAPVRLSGFATDLAVSPDGATIAYAVDVDGRRGLYIRPVDQFQGAPVSTDAVDTPFFSPDGASIGFYSVAEGALKRMPLGGGPADTIVELEGAARGVTWGPDDTVVFATNDASTGLLEVAARGGTARVLTVPDAGEDHLWPEFLPGGRAVLFTVRSGPGNFQVAVLDRESGTHRMLVSGSQARYAATGHLVYGADDRLLAARFDARALALLSEPIPVLEGVVPSDSGAAMFAFSNGGSLAYVSGAPLADNRILAFVDMEGNRTPLGLPPMPYRSPRLSPDGSRVAVEVAGPRRSSIWVYDLEGNVQGRELTTDGNNVRPEWTPDGERVTFASDRSGAWGIYWQPADGSRPAVRLTTAEPGREHWAESWIPGGSTLAYVVVDGEDRGIRMLDLDGAGRVRADRGYYDVDGFHENGAVFSPDGDWLAYYSNESAESTNDNQIWVQTVPPSGVKHLITHEGGVFPLWSPDGRELFYRRPGTAALDGTRLIAVDIEDASTYALGPERELPIRGFSVFTTYRDYDITVDGERFLMVYSEDYAETAEGPLRQVNFVYDWFEELAERVRP